MLKKIFKFYEGCKEDNIGAYAAQSAFFIILSTIPFLLVLVSLLKYTTLGKEDLVQVIRVFCPEYLLPLLVMTVDEVYEHSVGLLSVTVVAAIWSAAKGLQYITNGLNAVYSVDENRNWFVLRFWAIIYTLIFAMTLLFFLAFWVFGKYVKQIVFANFPKTAFFIFFESGVKWLFGMAVLIIFFSIIYKVIPNKKLRWKKQLIGACFTAIGWFVFSYGLAIYVDYFNGFSMYGSLTTIVLVMLWIYFCVYIMMIGAELNAFLS